jgi:hypothetical protein
MNARLTDALRAAAIASSMMLAFGYSATGSAQTSNDAQARCSELQSAWGRYNGRSGYSKNVEVDAAIADCQKGNYAAGIATLTKAMERAGVPVPQVQSATSR